MVTKQDIRAEILSRRRSQNVAEKKLKDTSILRRLLRTPAFKKAKTIMLYLPINGEADISGMMQPTQILNKKIVLPRISSHPLKRLTLHQIADLTKDVSKGSHGIMEPKTNTPRVKKEEIDLVLVPGVAFAKNGHRIGYGQGFYDRLLKNLHCPKIGIAYQFQIVKNITGEKHDQKVDAIITEKETIHCPLNKSPRVNKTRKA